MSYQLGRGDGLGVAVDIRTYSQSYMGVDPGVLGEEYVMMEWCWVSGQTKSRDGLPVSQQFSNLLWPNVAGQGSFRTK